MLDRTQHLKLFLTGSGDTQKDVDAVLSDQWVREELDRHPIDVWRLLDAVRRVSQFGFQEDQFLHLFSRYKSPDNYAHTNPGYDPPVNQIRGNRAKAKRATNG
jgi:hypothetical protein